MLVGHPVPDMSDVDVRKTGLGVLFLGVGTALVFGPDSLGAAVPVALVALGALGLAVTGVVSAALDGLRPV
jgi:hypothetical protein